MTEQELSTPSNGKSEIGNRKSHLPLVLTLWLAIQLAVVLLVVLRIPFAARYPEPAEELAAQVMVAVQITTAALLFPVICAGWQRTMIMIATSWPMLILAGLLADMNWVKIGLAGTYVSIWIIVLAVWRGVLISPRRQVQAVAAALLLSLGGVLLWYLRGEFVVRRHDPQWPGDGLFGPVMGAFAQFGSEPVAVHGWLLLTVLLLIGVAGRQLIHRLSTSQS